MKKLLFVFGLLAASFTFVACDDDDEKISVVDLPAKAREFLDTHFPGQETRLVEKDNDSYDVSLKNGFDIDFDLAGEWDDVDGHTQAIPQSIIDLIPEAIPAYVAEHYAGSVITEVNKELYGYEIDLDNRIELKFDKNGTFLGIDT